MPERVRSADSPHRARLARDTTTIRRAGESSLSCQEPLASCRRQHQQYPVVFRSLLLCTVRRSLWFGKPPHMLTKPPKLATTRSLPAADVRRPVRQIERPVVSRHQHRDAGNSMRSLRPDRADAAATPRDTADLVAAPRPRRGPSSMRSTAHGTSGPDRGSRPSSSIRHVPGIRRQVRVLHPAIEHRLSSAGVAAFCGHARHPPFGELDHAAASTAAGIVGSFAAAVCCRLTAAATVRTPDASGDSSAGTRPHPEPVFAAGHELAEPRHDRSARTSAGSRAHRVPRQAVRGRPPHRPTEAPVAEQQQLRPRCESPSRARSGLIIDACRLCTTCPDRSSRGG